MWFSNLLQIWTHHVTLSWNLSIIADQMFQLDKGILSLNVQIISLHNVFS